MLMQQTAKIYLLTLDVNWKVRLQFSTLLSAKPNDTSATIYLFILEFEEKRYSSKEQRR
jgi:hypothetical protein